MKTITLINWIIIAIYGVYAIFIYLDTNRSGIDAAGKGMAMGFLFIGLIYLAVLIGLNFINVKWVRILVLLLGGMPLFYFALQSISTRQVHKKYDRLREENSKFKDPHLNAMMTAMKNCDLKEMESLLAKDNSQINQVGVNNRQTILGIAVRKAWTDEKPEASAIVHLILKNGADPNLFHPDTYGTYAPLAMYGEYIDIPVFRALLEAGADPSALGEHSEPLFYTLVERGDDDLYEKVELLLKHGLDPNIPLGNDQPFKLNFSPLVYAAHNKQWAVCNLLINNGADVNFQPADQFGRTFWLILDEKGKEYRASGNIPADYQQLLSNEKIEWDER